MRGRLRGGGVLDAALETGELVAANPGEVWPYWLEQQADAPATSFVPLGTPHLARNVTHRNWTPVGTLDHGAAADVDPRGLVVPRAGAGALDWWLRGPGGWIHPSRCAPEVVDQRLVDGAPVVRTTVAMPGGGSVEQTVFAAAGPERVVVELYNTSDAPVAVALVVRPFDLDGVRRIRTVAVTASGIEVDGAVFAVLGGPPLGAVCGRLGGASLVEALTSVGEVEATPDRSAAVCAGEDRGGRATAAAVIVVTHGRRRAVVLPCGRRGEDAPAAESAAVVRGWTSMCAGAPALDMGDSAVSAAFAAQPGHLLARGHRRALDPEIARALCLIGLHGHVRDALSREVGDARGGRTGIDAAALALVAGELWRHTRDVEYFGGLNGEMQRCLVSLDREVTAAARRGAAGAGPRLLVVAAAASAAADIAAATGSDGAAAGASGIAAAAEEEADVRFAAERDSLTGDLRRCLEWGLARLRRHLVPSSDPRLAVAMTAAGDPAEAVGDPGGGLDLRATAALAEVLACARSTDAWDLLVTLAGTALPAWTWPGVWNPLSGGGCGGEGADVLVAARFVTAAVACCVAPTADGLALVPVVPASAPFGASRLATPYGYLDLQVRRDGDATVLGWRGLWGRRNPVLTAPGLDPTWSTSEPAGTVTLRP